MKISVKHLLFTLAVIGVVSLFTMWMSIIHHSHSQMLEHQQQDHHHPHHHQQQHSSSDDDEIGEARRSAALSSPLDNKDISDQQQQQQQIQSSVYSISVKNNPKELTNILLGTSSCNSFALLIKEVTMLSEKLKTLSSNNNENNNNQPNLKFWLYDDENCNSGISKSSQVMSMIESLLQQKVSLYSSIISNTKSSSSSSSSSFRFASDETFFYLCHRHRDERQGNDENNDSNYDHQQHHHLDHHDTHSVLKKLRAETIFKTIPKANLLFAAAVAADISKTNIMIQLCDDNNNSTSPSPPIVVVDPQFVETYIQKRFGKLATTTVTTVRTTSSQNQQQQLFNSDIVIMISSSSSSSSTSTRSSIRSSSSSSNCHAAKFLTVMQMLPGTSFIDVIDTSSSSSSSITISKEQQLDIETLCSLLRVEYVEFDIGRSQGYLLQTGVNSNEAKLHPFTTSATSSSHTAATVASKNNKIRDLSMPFPTSKSTTHHQQQHQHSETRWFEVLKETMASSYFRKYRLKGNVREFDVRRN